MEFEIYPPLEVIRLSDADRLGKSQAMLHEQRYRKTYSEQGKNATVRYTVEPNGTGALVRLFVDLT